MSSRTREPPGIPTTLLSPRHLRHPCFAFPMKNGFAFKLLPTHTHTHTHIAASPMPNNSNFTPVTMYANARR